MQFQPKQILFILLGFAKFNRIDINLFKNASDAIMRRQDFWSEFKEFPTWYISMLVSSFSILKINDDVLLTTISNQIVNNDKYVQFSFQDITLTLHAFAKFCELIQNCLKVRRMLSCKGQIFLMN